MILARTVNELIGALQEVVLQDAKVGNSPVLLDVEDLLGENVLVGVTTSVKGLVTLIGDEV